MKFRLLTMVAVGVTLIAMGGLLGCNRASKRESTNVEPNVRPPSARAGEGMRIPGLGGGSADPSLAEALAQLTKEPFRTSEGAALSLALLLRLHGSSEAALAVAKTKVRLGKGDIAQRASVQLAMGRPAFVPSKIARDGCFAVVENGIPIVAMNTRAFDYSTTEMKESHQYTPSELAEISPMVARYAEISKSLGRELTVFIQFSDSYRSAITEALAMPSFGIVYEYREVGPFYVLYQVDAESGAKVIIAMEFNPLLSEEVQESGLIKG